MNKTLFLLVFIFLCVNLKSQENIKTINSDYSYSLETPIKIIFGDTIINLCDTLFLINKQRYSFYKDIHLLIQEDKYIECKELLQLYELRIKEHESAYQLLIENSKKTKEINKNVHEDMRKSLEDTKLSLNKAQYQLSQSISELETANNILKKEIKNSRIKNLIFGVGGIGVGIVGSLIFF